MMHPRRQSQAGISSVELMIATAALIVIIGGMLSYMLSAVEANEATSRSSRLSQKTHRVVNQIAEELLGTSTSQLGGSVTATGSDSVSYRQPITYDGTGITWGNLRRIELQDDPRDAAGDDVDNDGDGFVDEKRIVMRVEIGQPGAVDVVICEDVAELLEGEQPGGGDDNGNGLTDEPGLVLSLDGRMLTIRLTTLEASPNGVMSRTAETTIAFRN